MFGGILTKILGGALIISLLGTGALYVKGKWQAARYEKEIQELQTISIKQQAMIYKLKADKKAKLVVIKYREKKSYEIDKINQADASSSDVALDNIAIEYGMLSKNPTGASGNTGGNTKH